LPIPDSPPATRARERTSSPSALRAVWPLESSNHDGVRLDLRDGATPGQPAATTPQRCRASQIDHAMPRKPRARGEPRRDPHLHRCLGDAGASLTVADHRCCQSYHARSRQQPGPTGTRVARRAVVHGRRARDWHAIPRNRLTCLRTGSSSKTNMRLGSQPTWPAVANLRQCRVCGQRRQPASTTVEAWVGADGHRSDHDAAPPAQFEPKYRIVSAIVSDPFTIAEEEPRGRASSRRLRVAAPFHTRAVVSVRRQHGRTPAGSSLAARHRIRRAAQCGPYGGGGDCADTQSAPRQRRGQLSLDCPAMAPRRRSPGKPWLTGQR
jgi:hypothetical protein